MAQITKIRLPDGRTLTPGDWTSAEPLYSTIEVGAGTYSTLSAFSYGIGGDVPGSVGPRKSNLSDTNLQGQGSQLPENEEIIVYAMMVEAFTINQIDLADVDGTGEQTLVPPPLPMVSVQDMLRLQEHLILVMRIANVKEYTRAPLGWFPASMGAHGVYAAQLATPGAIGLEGSTSNASYMTGSNGSTSVGGKRVFASPLYIEGGESLVVDFIAPYGEILNLSFVAASPAGKIRLRTYLDGYRRRPVA